MANNKSLAVWDVPMPVAIGENFAIKVGGAKGAKVEVLDSAGTVVASGTIGGEPLAGTEEIGRAHV